MKINPGKITILCLLAISCLSSVDARRRSRIDLPAQNSTNTAEIATLATASEATKVEAEKLEAPAPTTVPTTNILEEEEKMSESSSSEESPAYEDCDLDNISFEMITG